MNILKLKQQEGSLTKFKFGTRTSMSVFVVLASDPEKAEEILDYLLPNNTGAWKRWKSTIVSRRKSGKELVFDESDWSDPQDEGLLRMLYQDAQDAYNGFLRAGLH